MKNINKSNSNFSDPKGVILSLALLILALTLFVCAVKAENTQEFINAAKTVGETVSPLIETGKQ